ncbi:MAG TPA: molybdopterin-dependent oxidoreductase [Blastocatellia bacterium]|nr:molybdopterin-dependent oxidoreductase [Blastocatellia bacterium]
MSVTLRIDGEIDTPLNLEYLDLIARTDQKEISLSGRPATGIPVASLFEQVGVKPSATHVTLHAEHDDFAASIPIAAVAEAAVIFQIHGVPIEISKGGPFRFFIPDAAECAIGEVDECANVKYLDRIELTVGPGKDTRPRTKKEHTDLHQA